MLTLPCEKNPAITMSCWCLTWVDSSVKVKCKPHNSDRTDSHKFSAPLLTNWALSSLCLNLGCLFDQESVACVTACNVQAWALGEPASTYVFQNVFLAEPSYRVRWSASPRPPGCESLWRETTWRSLLGPPQPARLR